MRGLKKAEMVAIVGEGGERIMATPKTLESLMEKGLIHKGYILTETGKLLREELITEAFSEFG